MPSPKPSVFISYAHESDAFRESVRQLAEGLEQAGCNVLTDYPYRHRPPPEGWQTWMLKCIREADTVLVVCSPRYRARFEKTAPSGSGQGVTYEGAILTQAVYDASMRNNKYYPILPDGGSYDDIPTVLRGWWNNHRFPSGNEGIRSLIFAGRPDSQATATLKGPQPLRTPDGEFVKHARSVISRILSECLALKGEIDKLIVAQGDGDLVDRLEATEPLETVVNDFLRPATIACLDDLPQEGVEFKRRWEAAKEVLAWLAVLSVKGTWVEELERTRHNFAGFYFEIPVATELGVEIVSSRYRQRPLTFPVDAARADLPGADRFRMPLMPTSYVLQKELDALLLNIWGQVFPADIRDTLSQGDVIRLNAELGIRTTNRTAHHYLAFWPEAKTPMNDQAFLAALLKSLPNLTVICMRTPQGYCPLLVTDEYVLLAVIRSFLQLPQYLSRLR